MPYDIDIESIDLLSMGLKKRSFIKLSKILIASRVFSNVLGYTYTLN